MTNSNCNVSAILHSCTTPLSCTSHHQTNCINVSSICTHTSTSQQVYPFPKPSRYFSNLSKKKKKISNTLARRTSHGDGALSPLTCCFGPFASVSLLSVTQILHKGGEKTQHTTRSRRRLANNRPPPLIKRRIKTSPHSIG